MKKSDGNLRIVSLVTGIAGFCGSHLAEHLLELGQRVVGVEIEGASLNNLDSIIEKIELHQADITDLEQIRRLVYEIAPDHIYHLAALTKPANHFHYRPFFEVNVYGTINLLESIQEEAEDCRVLIAGSSAQYGMVRPDDNPIRETHTFCPITHYAVSKSTQGLVAHCYWLTKGLQVIRTRAFNIIGPRQSPNLVGSAFAKQIAEIEAGLKEPIIEVGNLESKRDFVDVRDAVRAYQFTLEQGKPGEVYNVCSGQARSIRSILEYLCAQSSVKYIEIQQSPIRMQSADVPIQVGDYGKLKKLTGWQPEIPLEQSLLDLLEYWRKKCRRDYL